MKRRDFLKSASILGSTFLGSNYLLANTLSSSDPDHFLVFLTMEGGWDTTLCMDPWDSETRLPEEDLFVEYRHDELLNWGGRLFGPAMKPLKGHAADITALNGMFMNSVDNGHPALLSYIMRGKADGNSADMPVAIANAMPADDFGVLHNGGVYKHDLRTESIGAESLRGQSQSTRLNGILEYTGQLNPGGSPLYQSLESFSVAAPRRAKVSEIYNSIESDNSDMKVIASAFAAQGAQFAQYNIRLDGNLDTHSDHVRNHMNLLKAGFTQVSDIFSLFKSVPFMGGTLFDRTTFVVCSEFSRTAALNGGQGKDHNPMANSVLLAGYGIQKGKKIGAVKTVTRAQSATGESYQIALPFDYQSGQVVRDPSVNTLIFPQNMWRTISELFPVNWRRMHGLDRGEKLVTGLLS